MTEKLRIIYVPDAKKYKRETFESSYINPQGKSSKELREAYQNLRSKVNDLPQRIGVVSFDWQAPLFKRLLYERDLEEDEEPMKGYLPLVILRDALKLKEKEEVGNALIGEHIYRSLMLAFSQAALSLEQDALRHIYPDALATNHNMFITLKQKMGSCIEKMGAGNVDQESLTLLKELLEMVDRRDLGWDHIQKRYEAFLKRFQKNRVSEDFPLVYLTPGLRPPLLYGVKLTDRTHTPRNLNPVIDILKKGYEAAGEEMPADLPLLADLRRDLFGRSQEFDSLDSLLKFMQKPHTLITDTYIVDHFPQLEKRDFETIEIK
jgi:hypothetical protein